MLSAKEVKMAIWEIIMWDRWLEKASLRKWYLGYSLKIIKELARWKIGGRKGDGWYFPGKEKGSRKSLVKNLAQLRPWRKASVARVSEDEGIKWSWRNWQRPDHSVAEHVKEFEFYFKCNWKPQTILSMKGTWSNLPQKKKNKTQHYGWVKTYRYLLLSKSLVKCTVFPNQFEFCLANRIWMAKNLSKILFESTRYQRLKIGRVRIWISFWFGGFLTNMVK